MVQWLRIRLPMWGMQIQSLVREHAPMCCEVTKPAHHSYRTQPGGCPPTHPTWEEAGQPNPTAGLGGEARPCPGGRQPFTPSEPAPSLGRAWPSSLGRTRVPRLSPKPLAGLLLLWTSGRSLLGPPVQSYGGRGGPPPSGSPSTGFPGASPPA